MPLAHAIVHGISRPGITAPIHLSLSEAELPVSGYSDELVRELKQALMAKAGKQYGQFSQDLGQAQLAGWLREFCESKLGFASFSSKVVDHFKSQLSTVEAEFEGFMLIALEKLADADLLYIFVLQQSEVVYIDGDLTLQTSQNLDVSGIRLGTKINLTDWLTGENSYLSVLRARGEKEISEAFLATLGFADARDIAAETSEFLDIVRTYSAKLPEEEAHSCRTKVVDFCLDQDKRGEPVIIEDLSLQISDKEPTAFAEFVQQQQEVSRPALIPDRKQLRQFVRISGRNDQLSMSFSSECLGETIVYDKQTDSLTITNLPAPLKLRLIQHMQKLRGESGDE